MKKNRGGVQGRMMSINDFISSYTSKLKNEENEVKSFNGQSVTFTLSNKEV